MFEIKSRMNKKIFIIMFAWILLILLISCETEQTTPGNGEIASLETEVAVLREELSSLRSINVVLEAENVRLARDNEQLSRDNRNLDSEVRAIRSDIISLERQVERLESASEHMAGIYSIASVVISAFSGFALSLLLTRIKTKNRNKPEKSVSEDSSDEAGEGFEDRDKSEPEDANDDAVDPDGILRIGRFKN